MRLAALVLLTVLLLAGCMGKPASTATQPPASPQPALGLPRSDDSSMVVDYTLRLRTCQGADGSTDLNGTPGRVIVKPQKGDRTLRVTLTWTAASPAVQEMTVALVPLNDTVVYADAHGPSPLVLETQARPLLEAEDPDGFRVLASPGGACGTAPSVGSAQKQAAKVHIEWNAAS